MEKVCISNLKSFSDLKFKFVEHVSRSGVKTAYACITWYMVKELLKNQFLNVYFKIVENHYGIQIW